MLRKVVGRRAETTALSEGMKLLLSIVILFALISLVVVLVKTFIPKEGYSTTKVNLLLVSTELNNLKDGETIKVPSIGRGMIYRLFSKPEKIQGCTNGKSCICVSSGKLSKCSNLEGISVEDSCSQVDRGSVIISMKSKKASIEGRCTI
ncbi:hypothetical protein J4401_00480 [Candidatus Woesearchaeota archaeon]|nr:hypothetical protein [Candidatus Woesearchaeota archaeon]